MQRCLELAEKGLGNVAPNPMVGALLVNKGRIIGEGFHEKFGEAHAEINAINSVSDKSLLKDSELYVSLEPCSHTGKTPACTSRIIELGITKVFIASLDPNRNVSGKGAELLRSKGVDVAEGVLKERADFLNRRFFMYHQKLRPYVILKWAQSSDGFIGPVDGKSPIQISNEEALDLSHRWRTEEQGILVGSGTALSDNPKLNARRWIGKSPVRILVDRRLKLPPSSNLFDGTAKTLLITQMENLEGRNAQPIIFDEHQFNSLIPNIMYALYIQEIQSLIVEGGAKMLQSFLDSNLWDEVRIITSSKKLDQGLKAPSINLPVYATKKMEDNSLKIFFNPHA